MGLLRTFLTPWSQTKYELSDGFASYVVLVGFTEPKYQLIDKILFSKVLHYGLINTKSSLEYVCMVCIYTRDSFLDNTCKYNKPL